MKHLLTTLILSSFLISTLGADDFKNWYFDYFSEPVIYSGKFESPDGRHVETSTGVQMGEVSKDGKTFTQTAKYEYKNQGTEVKATLLWKRLSDDTFTGVYEDSNGTEVLYTLLLKEGKRFEVVSAAPDGAKITSRGRMDTDGVIRCLDMMTAPDGRLVLSIDSEMRQKKKVEPIDTDNPVKRPDNSKNQPDG